MAAQKVHYGKTADWIGMPFGLVSGVGRGTSVIDGGGDCQREDAILEVNLGRPIVTNGDSAMRLFPNGFGEDLSLSIWKRSEYLACIVVWTRLSRTGRDGLSTGRVDSDSNGNEYQSNVG